MPDRFEYETAKAIFAESELLKVREDGVWLREKRVPRLLFRPERREFLEHPLDALWVPGKPDPASLPVLPIPFTAAELAASFLVGAGALYASDRFGDMVLRVLSKRAQKAQKADLEKALQTLDCGPAAKAAVREAFAELRRAAEVVGTLQMPHTASAQRKERRREALLRRARKNLGIDVNLAKVNAELEAELRAAKSRDAAKKKRDEIFPALDDWKAKDVDYRNLRDAVADAKKATEVAEAIWLKDLLNHLIGDQSDAEKASQAPTPMPSRDDDQGNGAQQDTTAQPAIDRSLLATPEQLISAFGSFTGMHADWFNKTKDKPKLHAAIKIAGTSGTRSTPPLLCPLEVMQWLTDPKRRTGRMGMSQEKGWERLKAHFPNVYDRHSSASPLND